MQNTTPPVIVVPIPPPSTGTTPLTQTLVPRPEIVDTYLTPPLENLFEGRDIRCNGIPNLFYRYENGKYRFFPSESVGLSWGLNQVNSQWFFDCSKLEKGPDFPLKPKFDKNQKLKNSHNNVCITASDKDNTYSLTPCDGRTNQTFEFSDNARLQYNGKCMDISPDGNTLNQFQCHLGENQKWVWDDKDRIKSKHLYTKCLDSKDGTLTLRPCSDIPSQVWTK